MANTVEKTSDSPPQKNWVITLHVIQQATLLLLGEGDWSDLSIGAYDVNRQQLPNESSARHARLHLLWRVVSISCSIPDPSGSNQKKASMVCREVSSALVGLAENPPLSPHPVVRHREPIAVEVSR